MVDGTRALVQRLVYAQRPDHEPLHLDNLVPIGRRYKSD
ncbi:hypothetical protein X736_31260 [Mesorhizobium sp. L2C089B000]|nr:hypothetical protein X736_31260 [Mesorhizobium sp. L2C089B000]